MAEGDLDGGPSNSEKRDVRERVDVHRLMNVIEPGSELLVEMAGKEPANVVSSAMARQLGVNKGGRVAHALAKPVVIVNSELAKKREHESNCR